MGTGEGQLEMEGLVRRQGLLRPDVADRPVGQVVADIVVVRDRRLDRHHPVMQGRGFEIVGRMALEPVGALKAARGRPVMIGPVGTAAARIVDMPFADQEG